MGHVTGRHTPTRLRVHCQHSAFFDAVPYQIRLTTKRLRVGTVVWCSLFIYCRLLLSVSPPTQDCPTQVLMVMFFPYSKYQCQAVYAHLFGLKLLLCLMIAAAFNRRNLLFQQVTIVNRDMVKIRCEVVYYRGDTGYGDPLLGLDW